jgi:hypothetical protein
MRVAYIALVIMLTANAVFGYVAEVSITEVASISNEQGEFRVLFRPADLEIPDSSKIDFATIIIPKTQSSRIISFEVCAVTRPWSSSAVGWSTPWSKAGGDFAESCISTWVIHPGVGESGHFIDVTEYVRSVASGEPNYGLIIKPVGEGPEGFSEDGVAVFSGLDGLKLRVLYRGKE